MGRDARTVNTVQATAFFGGEKGDFPERALSVEPRSIS
jgi:hypothetical protein